MSTPCPDEQTTQHFLRANGAGFGPVTDGELLAYVIFLDTTHSGRTLSGDSFPNNRLRAGTLSLARFKHTTQTDLERHVITPSIPHRGPLMGVSCAHVREIREVVVTLDIRRPDRSTVRGICVLDHVTQFDHDGHAVLKYAELPGPISQKRLKVLRSLIRDDLASKFGAILPIEMAFGLIS